MACAGAAASVAGCSGQPLQVPPTDPTYEGAVLFAQRCSGCHTLDVAGVSGSKSELRQTGASRTDGPNFNVRKAQRDDVLFAIRNGGYSGATMPANIVVGAEAEKVADFLAKYSGKERGTNDPTASGQGQD